MERRSFFVNMGSIDRTNSRCRTGELEEDPATSCTHPSVDILVFRLGKQLLHH